MPYLCLCFASIVTYMVYMFDEKNTVQTLGGTLAGETKTWHWIVPCVWCVYECVKKKQMQL